MMHLMVNSRQLPERKTGSGNENEGLVTFALEGQEPQRCSFKYLEADSVRSCEEREHGDGMGMSMSSVRRRHRRSASMDAPQLDTIRLGPTLTTSLAFEKRAGMSPTMPAKLMADDSTGRFAYISLDGRLVNAELATCATTIGGKLGGKEAQAWEEFTPMQRVLIVAVVAAAAAAAKHRNVKEIDRLLKSVENRVLRQHRIVSAISSFLHMVVSSLHTFIWTLVSTLEVTALWTALRWIILMGRLKLLPYMMCSQEKELLYLSQELNDICKLNSKQRACRAQAHPVSFWNTSPKTPKLQRRTIDENLQRSYVAPSTPMESSSIETSPVVDEVRSNEEAKWYVNPMVESLQDSQDNIFTPERCNSLFSPYTPGFSSEWITLRPSDMETSVSTSSWQTISNDGAGYKSMRALCAVVVLDLMRRILSILDNQSSVVMAALDTSVTDAKIQVAAMQSAISSCWNDSLPEALAALSLSPSEFDGYVLQGTSLETNASQTEENVVAWRQYLEKYDSEGAKGKSPTKSTLSDEENVTEFVKHLQLQIEDLNKSQKALLQSKNKEIDELKRVLENRDAELDKLLAAGKTTKIDVQESRVYQSSAVLRGRRYSTSSTPSSSRGHGTPQKQSAPSSDTGGNSILEHIRKDESSNLRNLPYLNTDVMDDGRSERGYDHETSSTPGSTIGDDCSLEFSETEVDSRFGSENCSLGDDLRCLNSKDRGSLQKQKSMSSDLRRAVTSSTSSIRSLARTQSSKSYTAGSTRTSKPLHTTLSGEIKVLPRSPGSSPGSSPRTSNLKSLGSSVAVIHRRSSSLDMNIQANNPETSRHNGSPRSQEISATHRKRWV